MGQVLLQVAAFPNLLRALKQVLLPRLEPSFIYDTYAAIRGRGVRRAVSRVMAFQRQVAAALPRSLRLDTQGRRAGL